MNHCDVVAGDYRPLLVRERLDGGRRRHELVFLPGDRQKVEASTVAEPGAPVGTQLGDERPTLGHVLELALPEAEGTGLA
jgi:hypothetical protein